LAASICRIQAGSSSLRGPALAAAAAPADVAPLPPEIHKNLKLLGNFKQKISSLINENP
jgi:hypothetical protein